MTTQFYEIVVYRPSLESRKAYDALGAWSWSLDAVTAHKDRALKDAETIHRLYGYSTYVAIYPDGDHIAEYGTEGDRL